MIKIENAQVFGFEAAIRGMRNPMNSWDKSDSGYECTMDKFGDCYNKEFILCEDCGFKIGPKDLELMMKLAKGGSVHAKYRRMITVYTDITAPRYWWTEFDTYKVGTVSNSCSTMHKIHEKEFTMDDFSHEHLFDNYINNPSFVCELGGCSPCVAIDAMEIVITALNFYRDRYLETKDKKYWWQMIQLLPQSYNQKRTVMLNYEVLSHIYPDRKDHKLDEWHDFCDWIKSLPYSKLITLEESK